MANDIRLDCMNEVSLSIIDSLINETVVELLQAHGVHLSATGYCIDDVPEPFAATIGFTSEHLRGILVLILDRSLALSSLPAFKREAPADDKLVADWTGELANQLLGRLKNGLHDYGLDIALGTPTVFAGQGMNHFSHKSPIFRCLSFEKNARCLVEFQADYSPGFELQKQVNTAGDALAEGEVMFF